VRNFKYQPGRQQRKFIELPVAMPADGATGADVVLYVVRALRPAPHDGPALTPAARRTRSVTRCCTFATAQSGPPSAGPLAARRRPPSATASAPAPRYRRVASPACFAASAY
jgi:hypothetical protein